MLKLEDLCFSCNEFLSTKDSMNEIDKIIERELLTIKQKYGYDNIKKELYEIKDEIKTWLLENKNDLSFEMIAKYESDADDYCENVFDYCDTYLDFDTSDSRYDTTYYIHLLIDKIMIYEEIREWETFDQSFNLVGLYVATITK